MRGFGQNTEQVQACKNRTEIIQKNFICNVMQCNVTVPPVCPPTMMGYLSAGVKSEATGPPSVLFSCALLS